MATMRLASPVTAPYMIRDNAKTGGIVLER
jgi:hypothetical protein